MRTYLGIEIGGTKLQLVVGDTHYGRVEDAHMGVCHMIAYAFMDGPAE